MTDELKPGQYIEEFASLGPKSYAHRTNDEKFLIKIKGLCLDGGTEDCLNFTSFLEMLDSLKFTMVPQKGSKKNLKTFELFQQNFTKKFKFTYSKRRIIDEQFNTLPFGYCEKVKND